MTIQDQIEILLGALALLGGVVLVGNPRVTKWLFDKTSVRWASGGRDPEVIKRENEAAHRSYDSELRALRWCLPLALIVIGLGFISQTLR